MIHCLKINNVENNIIIIVFNNVTLWLHYTAYS